MNYQNKKFSIRPLITGIVLGWIFPLFISAQQDDTLHISLDMRTPIAQGWLNPASEIIGLRGDQSPLSWGTTFPAKDPDGDGVYSAAIPFKGIKDSLILDFKIKVDGTDNPNDGWQTGRNHSVTVYAGKTNRLSLKWEDQAEAPPSTVTGNVEVIKNFDSAPLETRNLYIYLPPGYSKSGKRYPVLYMQDGQNLFDAAITGEEWKMDEAAQSLIKQNKIEPLIIVGIGNTKNRIDEYTPTRQIWNKKLKRKSPPAREGNLREFTGTFLTQAGDTISFRSEEDTLFAKIPGSDFWQSMIEKSRGIYYLPRAGITFSFHENSGKPASEVYAVKPPMGGDGNLYGDLIIKKVKPFIDGHFRTRPEARWTALGGSSLGGLISLYLGLKYPETFGSLLVVSPSVWWDNRWIIKMVNNLAGPTGQKIWLDIGTGESKHSVANARDLRDALLDKKWPASSIKYLEAQGAAHNERAWAERVPGMLRFLFPKDQN